MGRITWVCATCGEHFTRKYSVNRHNNNLHFGNGLIVRLLDYLVGRTSRQYLQSDPQTSKNYSPLIHDDTAGWSSKPVSQGNASNKRTYAAADSNNNNMHENSEPFSYYPAPNPISKADDKPVDKVQDRTRKYNELKTIVTRYYTVEGAETVLATARSYLSQGDDRFIDELLAMFRKPEDR